MVFQIANGHVKTSWVHHTHIGRFVPRPDHLIYTNLPPPPKTLQATPYLATRPLSNNHVNNEDYRTSGLTQTSVPIFKRRNPKRQTYGQLPETFKEKEKLIRSRGAVTFFPSNAQCSAYAFCYYSHTQRKNKQYNPESPPNSTKRNKIKKQSQFEPKKGHKRSSKECP